MVNDNIWLVVSNMNFIFHFIYGTILPIDELIFFKMVKTTNQLNLWQRIRICQDPLEHTLQSPDRKSVKT